MIELTSRIFFIGLLAFSIEIALAIIKHFIAKIGTLIKSPALTPATTTFHSRKLVFHSI